jgi:radical SAM peptide maturase (CXXX-repeat target family)/CXXX repeat peptide maturase
MVGTNGVLFGDPRFQRFMKKHREHLSVGMTIDGTQAKHDLNRVFPDGTGSYQAIIENVKAWIREFPTETTKVTFASADLPLLKESIIHLWELGLKQIPANVVFEDVWRKGDDAILEDQLRGLADYVIDNRLWNDIQCSLYSESLGFPLHADDLNRNWCGAGQMTAVDHQGLLYPCQRFMPYSLNNRKGYVIGDIRSGIDQDKMRPFIALNLFSQSRDECVSCEVASGCSWCQGFNYDSAPVPTIYHRATYICAMHKARVRANEYYWAKLRRNAGLARPVTVTNKRRTHLLILPSDDAVVHCSYTRRHPDARLLDEDDLQNGLRYAREHFCRPVILQPESGERLDLTSDWDPISIVSARSKHAAAGDILVFDNHVDQGDSCDNSILLVDAGNIDQLATLVRSLLRRAKRINLVLRGIEGLNDATAGEYERQLGAVAEELLVATQDGAEREVSVLTDRLHLTSAEDCGAGVHTVTLAPNGRFYLCPGFYHNDPAESVGSPSEGVDPQTVDLCRRRHAPLCVSCDAFQCRRCLFTSHSQTLHYNVPGRDQCVMSHVELKVTARLRERLIALGQSLPVQRIDVTTLDPLESVPVWKIVYGFHGSEAE